jgi:hypothetical protein
MLMYEQLQPIDISTEANEREISIALTVDTVETEAEGIDARASSDDEPDILASTESTISTEEHSLPSTAGPSIQLDNISTSQSNHPSLLEIIESRFENNRNSPSSSVTSTSTDDSLTHPDAKSRSTSFSSVHSGLQTPNFKPDTSGMWCWSSTLLTSGEEDNTTEIFVKTSLGKILALHLDKNITVRQLKIKLEELEGTPHEEQRLYASMMQLRDNDPVFQYDSSSIDMRLQTLGGSRRR